MKHASSNTARRIRALAFGAMAGLFALGSPAAAPDDDYNEAARRAEAQRKVMTAKCNELSGKQNELCEAQAKADYRTALADAEAKYKRTPDAAAEARKIRADSQYDVAKKRCEAKEGDARDVCEREAKSAHEAALAESERQTKIAVANVKARDATREANYKAAREKCKTLSGDEQDRCEKDAKKRFDQ